MESFPNWAVVAIHLRQRVAVTVGNVLRVRETNGNLRDKRFEHVRKFSCTQCYLQFDTPIVGQIFFFSSVWARRKK